MKASDYGIPHEPRWYWTRHEDDEVWRNGPFSDKADAISDGRGCAQTFYVGCVAEADFAGPEASEVLDSAAGSLYDACGEVGSECFDSDNVTKEAEAELDAELKKVFANWLTKHALWPQVGTIENIERIEPDPAETT